MHLSKPFDRLNREVLIAKLSDYGFRTSALRLIHSSLNERKQSVRSIDPAAHGEKQRSVYRRVRYWDIFCSTYTSMISSCV